MNDLFIFKSGGVIEFTLPPDNTSVIFESKYDHSLLRIRNMSFAELDQTRIWTKQEGWPAMKAGLAATYQLDPAGFYMLESDGEKIATISVVAYPAIKSAYIAFYIVSKELRGRGYGSLILNKTIEYTQNARGINTFALTCLENMMPLYKHLGFAENAVDEIWKLIAKEHVRVSNQSSLLMQLDEKLFMQLVNYDASIFGVARQDYLRSFINKSGTTIVISTDAKGINGYGVISEREPANIEPYPSYRIGPVYCDNVEIAENLIGNLLADTVKINECVFLEIPASNKASVSLIKSFGFEKLVDLIEMYRGLKPNPMPEQVFCCSSIVTGG